MNASTVTCCFVASAFSVALSLSGCANLTVTKVSADNDATTKGVRYYLPKPYLQVTPQPDGTISVDVIFLPDKQREYAIDTSSHFSSYTFQIARDEKGLLTSLEYKASTTAVGQQLASSGGAYAAQSYNIKAAGLVAVQAQVNSAQTSLDTARTSEASAEAALASDQAHGASAATITSDYAAVAQAKAKVQVAEQALQRAQTASQAVSTSVAASTPTTTTAPTMGNAFGQQTWNPPTIYNLPDKYPPVLFAINDSGSAVSLTAITSEIPETTMASVDELQKDVDAAAQRTFETTTTAIGPPTVFPSQQDVPVSSKQAVFYFDRPVNSPLTIGSIVVTDATPQVATSVTPKSAADGKSVSVDVTGLSPGKYIVVLKFSFKADSSGHVMAGTQQAKFTVTP
jgi:hypothetical protein